MVRSVSVKGAGNGRVGCALIRTLTSPAILDTSCRYFQALAKGEVPPVKTRLELPLESADERLGGITKGTLAVLHKQVSLPRTHWKRRA